MVLVVRAEKLRWFQNSDDKTFYKRYQVAGGSKEKVDGENEPQFLTHESAGG